MSCFHPLLLPEHEEQSAFTARSKKKTEAKDGNTTYALRSSQHENSQRIRRRLYSFPPNTGDASFAEGKPSRRKETREVHSMLSQFPGEIRNQIYACLFTSTRLTFGERRAQ
jgi:hypothetical protein